MSVSVILKERRSFAFRPQLAIGREATASYVDRALELEIKST